MVVLIDGMKRRMVEVMRSALGSADFTPTVSYSVVSGKLNIDILPHDFPGTPLEQWYQGEVQRKQEADAETKDAAPSVTFEGQGR